MEWRVIFHIEFNQWFDEQTPALKKDIAASLVLLRSFGAGLGRPHVDTLKGSIITNLKELRIQHKGDPYRLLFAFDPERQAILLVGGNKAKDKRWYQKNIEIAEKRYTEHLRNLRADKK